MPRRRSPTLPQLSRPDSYPKYANPYDRKNLPDAPADTPRGNERGRLQQATDDPVADDAYVAEVERLRQENATLKG